MLVTLAGLGCGGRVAADSSATNEPKTGTTGNAGNASGGSSSSSQGSGGSNGSTAGGASGPSSGGSSGGSTGGGGTTGTAMCSDLPPWKLTSVDDAWAALTAPFPNAWQLCAGYTSYFCPKNAPFISFDASGTQASCGNLYEGGFVATTTLAITITKDETGTFLLRWPIPDGAATMILQAFGDVSGPRTISLSQHGDPPPPPSLMVPASPLP